MTQNGDKLALLYIYIHLVDGAGGADHIPFLIPLLIFKYQLLRLNHVHEDASNLFIHFSYCTLLMYVLQDTV